jgi:hypothetical protein
MFSLMPGTRYLVPVQSTFYRYPVGPTIPHNPSSSSGSGDLVWLDKSACDTTNGPSKIVFRHNGVVFSANFPDLFLLPSEASSLESLCITAV